MLRVNVCIPAHNEERNIGILLRRLINQQEKHIRICNIVVVSSAVDNTDNIVKEYSKVDDRVHLIKEPKRRGKAHAINLFLNYVGQNGDINVLESADTIPLRDTIEKLCIPFIEDPKVGMTGGRPIPLNNIHETMGYIGHILWYLHHKISLKEIHNPKLGEIIAFRNIIRRIPAYISAADEVYIQTTIRKMGYIIKYVPEAIVFNRAPENVHDFLLQRRRIYAGHLKVLDEQHYKPVTMDIHKVMLALLESIPGLVTSPKNIVQLIFGILLEVNARTLGYLDYKFFGRDYSKWHCSLSTKKVLS